MLDLFPLLGLLEQDLRLDDSLVDGLLILETIDVFTGMRVEVLERLGEFIIESIDESDDRTTNNDNGFTGGRRSFYLIVVIGSGFANGESGLGEEEVEKGVEKSLGGSPGFEGHVSVGSGVVIELGRDEGEDDSDFLIRGNGDTEETFESRNLGVAIGVL